MMQFYAFDVIGEIVCCSRFGLREDDSDKTVIIDAVDKSLVYSATIGLTPGWQWWIGTITDKLGIQPGFRKMLNFASFHIDKGVTGLIKSPKARSDLLDKMLPTEQKGKSTRSHNRQAASQNSAARSDTTAISLCSVIAHLTTYPDTLAALCHGGLDEATASVAFSDQRPSNKLRSCHTFTREERTALNINFLAFGNGTRTCIGKNQLVRVE